ncbi:hypothetical protein NDU88_005824 [Pleurodeles waltl]|uniref:Uncharacterized protein n=1 Tax=Pleurodeles waltl TaxID=8319 RepID=A0AAV7L8Q1_PLEWA|nr:hypothetical protein NDU88_005824 [Pleurodeles waltl]
MNPPRGATLCHAHGSFHRRKCTSVPHGPPSTGETFTTRTCTRAKPSTPDLKHVAPETTGTDRTWHFPPRGGHQSAPSAASESFTPGSASLFTSQHPPH